MKNEDKKIEGATTPPKRTTTEPIDGDSKRSNGFWEASFQDYSEDGEFTYTAISNNLLRDQSISPECIWLVAYLCTNAKGWKIKVSQVANHTKGYIGRDKIRRLINEAIEAGYMMREKVTVNNLSRLVYYVKDRPIFKKCFRRPENQSPEDQTPVNHGPKEITIEKKYQKEKKEEGGASPSSNPLPPLPSSKKKAQQPKEEVAPRVMLDSVQQKSLLDKLGGSLELRQKCYEKLSDWKIGKNKTDCKSDYLAICNWVIDAVKDASLSSTSVGTNNYEKDKNLAIKILTSFPLRKDIDVGNNYIEFDNGRQSCHIKFGEKDFTLKAIQQIRNRKLLTEGL